MFFINKYPVVTGSSLKARQIQAHLDEVEACPPWRRENPAAARIAFTLKSKPNILQRKTA